MKRKSIHLKAFIEAQVISGVFYIFLSISLSSICVLCIRWDFTVRMRDDGSERDEKKCHSEIAQICLQIETWTIYDIWEF